MSVGKVRKTSKPKLSRPLLRSTRSQESWSVLVAIVMICAAVYSLEHRQPDLTDVQSEFARKPAGIPSPIQNAAALE